MRPGGPGKNQPTDVGQEKTTRRRVFREVSSPAAACSSPADSATGCSWTTRGSLVSRRIHRTPCGGEFLTCPLRPAPQHLGISCLPSVLAASEKCASTVCPPPAPGANGAVELSPLEFLDRLADLIPPPCKHRHRYHGVFAPNHKLRRAVTAVAIGNIGKQRDSATGGHAVEGCCGSQHKPRSHDTSRIAWAKLMARVGEEFPLQCPAWRRHPIDRLHHGAGANPQDSDTPRRTARAATAFTCPWPADPAVAPHDPLRSADAYRSAIGRPVLLWSRITASAVTDCDPLCVSELLCAAACCVGLCVTSLGVHRAVIVGFPRSRNDCRLGD
jgi:hypothetical protein